MGLQETEPKLFAGCRTFAV